MRQQIQFTKVADLFYQVQYPEEFDSVLRGDAYWYPHPINIIDYQNKFYSMHHYREFDTNKPKCWTCGKFVKKGEGCAFCR